MSSYSSKRKGRGSYGSPFSNWRPNTGDYNRHGDGELLGQALRNLRVAGVQAIEDSGGTCGYQGQVVVEDGPGNLKKLPAVIVAKKELYGNIVSVASHLLARAIDQDLWIIMYLASAGAYYKFDPQDIAEHTDFVNHYGLEAMNNFNIRLGIRINPK